MSNEATARLLPLLHPMRAREYLLSDLNPSLAVLPLAAEEVRQHRHPASEDNAFLQLKQAVSKQVVGALNFYADLRDSCVEQMVKFAYGPMGLGALFPPEPPLESKLRRVPRSNRRRSSPPAGRVRAGRLHRGGRPDADRRDQEAWRIDRRSFLIADEISERRRGQPAISEAESQSVVAEQALLMQLDPEAALEALPRLLPSETDRERAVAIVARIMMLEPACPTPTRPWRRWSEIPRPRSKVARDPSLVVQGGTS